MGTNLLRNALNLSMAVTLFGSLLFLSLGLFLHFFLQYLLESYFVLLAQDGSNSTKLLINLHESIVPTKDDLPEEIDLGKLPQFVSLAISSVGAILFVFSLFGYTAVSSKNTDCLFSRLMVVNQLRGSLSMRRKIVKTLSAVNESLLIIVITVSLICQCIIFGRIVDLNSQINFSTKEILIEALHGTYEVGAKTSNSFTFLMNSVMLVGQCCGIEGPADFLDMGVLNFSYVVENTSHYAPVMFPLACCHQSYIRNGFQATIECALSKDISKINLQGCYEETYVYVHDHYGSLITSVFVFMIVWETLQIIAGLAILFPPSNVERDAIKRVFETAEFKDLNIKPEDVKICKPKQRITVFVPTANVASNTSIDDMAASQIW